MLRKTDLSRDSAARGGRCFFDFLVAIAGAYGRLPGSGAADYKIARLEITVKGAAHSANQLIRTLLGDAKRPCRVFDSSRGAIIDPDRVVCHGLII